MANNADLTKDILALAPETVVEGKTNKELVEILKDLRANATPEAEVEKETEVEATSTPEAEVEKETEVEATSTPETKKVKVKKAPYEIAKGKSITCKKGLLGEGAEIKLEYVGDKKSFENLIDKGFVVKN